MNHYAHIDMTEDLNRYVVRVTTLDNQTELARFEHRSELSGTKLRREIERIAEAKVTNA